MKFKTCVCREIGENGLNGEILRDQEFDTNDLSTFNAIHQREYKKDGRFKTFRLVGRLNTKDGRSFRIQKYDTSYLKRILKSEAKEKFKSYDIAVKEIGRLSKECTVVNWSYTF